MPALTSPGWTQAWSKQLDKGLYVMTGFVQFPVNMGACDKGIYVFSSSGNEILANSTHADNTKDGLKMPLASTFYIPSDGSTLNICASQYGSASINLYITLKIIKIG